jgi:hypothetical protein
VACHIAFASHHIGRFTNELALPADDGGKWISPSDRPDLASAIQRRIN